ncbi:MAG: hypothetical protein ABIT20_19540 [Gemmatimonadaceae bacterium]
MPSRAERRRAGEWVLRAAVFAVLGVALWRSVQRPDASRVSRGAATSALTRDLGAIVTHGAVTAVDLTIDAMPTRIERDALIALRRNGVAVHWTGTPPALAIEATRAREPEARARLHVVGGGTQVIVLVDSAGLLDTVRAGAGATVDAASIVGAVRAEQGKFAASAYAPIPDARRAVLVLGRADWETKFVMQALSEAGWAVRARIPAAPNVDVRDDGLLPLDTARYDVVVALDSSAADMAPAIARFVAQGGGLIAAGAALEIDQLGRLAPARAGERRPGRILLADDSVTTRDLPLRPLSLARSDAVSLQREQPGVTLAARRAGMGRVIVVGYDESWRWRMLGGSTGLAAHRQWWSSAAGSVAPDRESSSRPTGDAAPLASLLSALGPSSPPEAATSTRSRDSLPIILLVIMSACLLAEIASRRFRGAR